MVSGSFPSKSLMHSLGHICVLVGLGFALFLFAWDFCAFGEGQGGKRRKNEADG